MPLRPLSFHLFISLLTSLHLPQEAIYLKINNKVPGLGLRLDTTRLDLQYGTAFNAKVCAASWLNKS